MQNQGDPLMMTCFLAAMSPVIAETVKRALRSCGMRVEEQGQGLETVFVIKSGEKRADFHLHNLLLEIATIDRDETPLRFDERLNDFDYFATKSAILIDSKLKILFELLSHDDVDKVIENVSQKSSQYERIRIIKLGE